MSPLLKEGAVHQGYSKSYVMGSAQPHDRLPSSVTLDKHDEDAPTGPGKDNVAKHDATLYFPELKCWKAVKRCCELYWTPADTCFLCNWFPRLCHSCDLRKTVIGCAVFQLLLGGTLTALCAVLVIHAEAIFYYTSKELYALLIYQLVRWALCTATGIMGLLASSNLTSILEYSPQSLYFSRVYMVMCNINLGANTNVPAMYPNAWRYPIYGPMLAVFVFVPWVWDIYFSYIARSFACKLTEQKSGKFRGRTVVNEQERPNHMLEMHLADGLALQLPPSLQLMTTGGPAWSAPGRRELEDGGVSGSMYSATSHSLLSSSVEDGPTLVRDSGGWSDEDVLPFLQLPPPRAEAASAANGHPHPPLGPAAASKAGSEAAGGTAGGTEPSVTIDLGEADGTPHASGAPRRPSYESSGDWAPPTLPRPRRGSEASAAGSDGRLGSAVPRPLLLEAVLLAHRGIRSLAGSYRRSHSVSPTAGSQLPPPPAPPPPPARPIRQPPVFELRSCGGMSRAAPMPQFDNNGEFSLPRPTHNSLTEAEAAPPQLHLRLASFQPPQRAGRTLTRTTAADGTLWPTRAAPSVRMPWRPDLPLSSDALHSEAAGDGSSGGGMSVPRWLAESGDAWRDGGTAGQPIDGTDGDPLLPVNSPAGKSAVNGPGGLRAEGGVADILKIEGIGRTSAPAGMPRWPIRVAAMPDPPSPPRQQQHREMLGRSSVGQRGGSSQGGDRLATLAEVDNLS